MDPCYPLHVDFSGEQLKLSLAPAKQVTTNDRRCAVATSTANPNPSQAIGRLSEWYRRMEEAGLTFEDLQTPIDNASFRSDLVRFWQDGGRDMAKVIHGVVEEGWFAFTTTEATLNELWKRNRGLFVGKGDRWWKDDEPFANEKGTVRKVTIRLSALPGSLDKYDFSERLNLLSTGEEVSTVRDLIEGLILYWRKTRKKPLFVPWTWMMTKSFSSKNGNRVGVTVGPEGIGVDAHWSDLRSKQVLAVARNLPIKVIPEIEFVEPRAS